MIDTRPRDRPFHVAIFSFNRGQHLENCVETTQRHMPNAAIAIYDDDSDDPDTLRVLERLSEHLLVYRSSVGHHDNPKVGGLYGNMQRAIDSLPDEAIVFFLQDDMQFVRDLEPDDREVILDYFDKSERAAFLWTSFERGYRRGTLDLRFDSSRGVYFRAPDDNKWGAHFGAACTARVDRLRAVGWQFRPREKLNDAAAKEHFEPMGHMRNPLSMFLPSVPVYRGRRRSFALRAAERRINAGLHPYRPMTPQEVEVFRKRDVEHFAFAEDWLTLAGEPLPTPWKWGPFQDETALRRLDRAERLLRRLVPSRG